MLSTLMRWTLRRTCLHACALQSTGAKSLCPYDNKPAPTALRQWPSNSRSKIAQLVVLAADPVSPVVCCTRVRLLHSITLYFYFAGV